MQFLNERHKERFKELLQSDNTNREDVERRSLFYILSGNGDLFRKRNHIYDFKDHSIEPDCLDSKDVDFSTTPPTISEADEWIPTYDLNAAAADIWEEKAATVADEFDFKADGGSFTRSQKEEKYLGKSRFHSSRKSAKSKQDF